MRNAVIQSSLVKRLRSQAGSSLLEALFAIVVLMVCVTGILTVFPAAALSNTDSGEVGTRTIEYAQDKMEQLLAIPYDVWNWDITNGSFDTLNTCNCGTGLGNESGAPAAPSKTYGSIVINAEPAGYTDFLDINGNFTNTNSAAYIRQWQISVDATGNIKTITVIAYARHATGNFKIAPSTKLVAYKVRLK
jgi:Tfp pilus assembly protein PilV